MGMDFRFGLFTSLVVCLATGCPGDSQDDTGTESATSTSSTSTSSSSSSSSLGSSTTTSAGGVDDGSCGPYSCGTEVVCSVPQGPSSGTTSDGTGSTTSGAEGSSTGDTSSTGAGTTGRGTDGETCGPCLPGNGCYEQAEDLGAFSECGGSIGGVDLDFSEGYLDDSGVCCYEVTIRGDDCNTGG